MSESTVAVVRPKRGIWELEPAHTTVAFIGRHLGLSRVRGRFTDVRATIEVAENLELSSAEMWIEAASIESGVEMRDDHLRSPDFLNVEEFPQVHFVSTEVRSTGDDSWEVDGDLTIRGITRPVTLQVELAGVIDDEMFQTQRAGLVATTEINRHEWDMHWNMPLGLGGLVADTAKIEIDAEILLTPYVDPMAAADDGS
jgi:polyisoprenoid-binding protein YceI